MRGEYNIGKDPKKYSPPAAGECEETRGFLTMESRRRFLTTAIAVGVPTGILAFIPGVQARTRRPQNPPQQKDDDTRPPKIHPKLILVPHQNEIKTNVAR